MLMTPSLTSSFHPGFSGFGQDGIRHDLNRLYYSDYSRQGMIDPQVYGAPFYSGYNAVAPWGYMPTSAYAAAPYYTPAYQGYDPRFGYARPEYFRQQFDYNRPEYFRQFDYNRPEYFRQFDYNRPEYFRQFDYNRPEYFRQFDYNRPEYFRQFDYNRPEYFRQQFDYARPYDYTRQYDWQRSYDYTRPYDYARSFDWARQFEARPYDFNRSFETMRPQEQLPYARTSENMIRPIEGMPTYGTDAYSIPAVNSAETPDAFLLVVELPGVDLKDVNLQIHGSSLVLNAFRRPTWSNGTVTVNYHFAEGRFGTLRRVLPLPVGVLPGQIQANFLNGLLTIVLPKSGSGASLPQASIVINSNVPTTM